MQILKDNIRLQIENAAVRLFSSTGYAGAGMIEIAREAGISTGNIYRYYRNKQELLYSVVSQDFVQNCIDLLLEKIKHVKGMTSDEITRSEAFSRGNIELIDFLLCHRLKLLILMKGCPNTRFACFSERIRQTLVDAVAEHFAITSRSSDSQTGRVDKQLLDIIYQNLVNATFVILESPVDEMQCRQALQKLATYHLRGLSAFA
jgi:AcrR family transcriptional regulator